MCTNIPAIVTATPAEGDRIIRANHFSAQKSPVFGSPRGGSGGRSCREAAGTQLDAAVCLQLGVDVGPTQTTIRVILRAQREEERDAELRAVAAVRWVILVQRAQNRAHPVGAQCPRALHFVR